MAAFRRFLRITRGVASPLAVTDVVTTVARSLAPERDRPGRVLTAVERLEGAHQVDPVLRPLSNAVRALPEDARDALHGTWLGHPAHPLMVQIPIGTWLSAAVLDLVPGRGSRRGAGVLIAVGLGAAAPAAWAGLADWAELRKPQQRVGLVHAAANLTALGLYGSSLAARLRGRRMRGRALAYAGLVAVGAGGWLGGHLAYRQGAGTNHAEYVPAQVTPGWHALCDLADLPVGRPERRVVEDVPLVVVREADDTVHALADRCAHMAGPLSEGEIEDGCVRCPWHGSLFRLSDGWNVRGPSTAPQPAFETRVTDGRVEVRLPAEDKER
jgi:nitrite reductase/ring-hydroxylating ferredoxin subunit/uncharacterized membrane protein